MRHFDFNQARAYSYEQAIDTNRMLDLGRNAIKERVRRAFLNIFIRNQIDHTKNIAFLMNQKGQWNLSPAFDIVYAHNPSDDWTSEHQMSLSGKTDQCELGDLLAFGRFCDLKTGETKLIIEKITAAIGKWAEHCESAGLSIGMRRKAKRRFRVPLP